MLSALTLLPAALLLGRWAYWPFWPMYGSEHKDAQGSGAGWRASSADVPAPCG